TASARRRPLLLRPEVVDESERDVAHRRTVGDGDRHREEPDPALRVQRPVDRVDDDARLTAGAELHLADLLADEDGVDAGVLEAAQDRALGGGVDRRRLVTALAGADDRFAVGPGWMLREREPNVVHRGAAELEPVSQAGGRAVPRSA